MKKFIAAISLSLLFIFEVFSQSNQLSTTITSVQVQGQSLLPAEWENLHLNSTDTITFFYNTPYQAEGSDKVNFKAYLDGKIIENGLDNSESQYVTLKKLSEGAHVFKVCGYSIKNGEFAPAIIQFRVLQAQQVGASNNEIKNQGNNILSSFGNNMILYVLSAIILVLLVIIIYLIFSRRALLKPEKEKRADKETEKKKEENTDYKYAYDKLKNESKNLFETNGFLKIQIQELKAYVKDLEDANVQLVSQKEKLLDSNRQLADLQKHKDDLFAIAVHDIKNPASIIKGLIDLLTDYDLNAQDQQKIIKSLSETSTRIIDLAQKMSQVCARTKPEPEIILEAASLKEIIDSVYKRNMAYANSKNIKLINNTSLNTPNVMVDKGKMDEVIDNLINNAIKYGPEGTIVQVKSFFNQSKVTVEIIDTGVGFSEEDLKNVFQKGKTLSANPTGGETQSGLGLWIVKKIIEDHGGQISLESKKGKGSRFLFDLPIKGK